MGEAPIDVTVMLAPTPDTGRGALAIPLEDGHWLILAIGYGDRRPTRVVAEFDEFLATLPDPRHLDLTRHLEPISGIAIHRQQSAQSLRKVPAWPMGC
jgi:hypothetical protein